MVHSKKVAQALRERLRGEVWADEKTLARYARDQSIYRIPPLAVAAPEDEADVVAAVRFAAEAGLPVTPRGGGSGTAGAALGRGLLLLMDRRGPMNQLLRFWEEAGQPRVRVQPGLLHDDLQRALREHGYYLPADPSSGGISMLGGNIATKASGPHAFRHGSIDRYLLSVRFVTAAGQQVDTADEASIPPDIREGVLALRGAVLADSATVARLEARQGMKLASGYNLFTFLRAGSVGEHVAQLLVGSVGTLGVITEATLRAEPYIEGHSTMQLPFRHLREAGDAVPPIGQLGVAAIEILNRRSIQVLRERNADLGLPPGDYELLFVEFEGPQRFDQMDAVERLVQERGYDLVAAPERAEDEGQMERLWKARKAILPTLRNYGGRKALSVVNDVGVPEEHLAAFIEEVETIFDRMGLVAGIYGHAGSGNLHLRPLFDPADPHLAQTVQRVADEVYAAVLRYGGTITAEHGMGRLRTPYLAQEWGPAVIGHMRQVKQIFDPQGLLNPEVMFSDRSLTDDFDP